MVKTAKVVEDKLTGYWMIYCTRTGDQVGGHCSDELDAYKVANSLGYVVR